jgi:glutamate-1-semialdehyde 2,1-aminomutase
LVEAATAAGVPHSLGWFNSMMTLFFNPGPVTDWDTAARSDTARYARYFWGLLERGVYMPCSQFEALFVSAAHTEADIDATLSAAREVLAGLE